MTTGRVYGAALNFRGTLDALGNALHRDPYQKPPEAPVLFLKPANTWSSPGSPIVCPAGIPQLRMGGTLGVIFAKAATRVAEGDALSHLGGLTVVNDVSIPHTSYFRNAVREKCRDGFCPLGPRVPFHPKLDDIGIRIWINGELRASNSTANLVRSVSKLIADVTEFMTFSTGDILLVGEPENAPLAGPGDSVRVEVDGVGALENPVFEEHS